MFLRSIRNRSVGTLVLVPVLFSLLLINGCDSFFPSENALDHITITPSSRFMSATETQQFTATGVNGNGTSSDVTSTATWTSSNTSAASVSSTGLVTAIAAGTANITASAQNTEASTNVIVTASALNSIAIAPTNTTVTTGLTSQFTATGTFQDGTTQDLTTLVTWTSSTTTVATINTAGLATGVSAGTTTITATASNSTGTITQTTQLIVQ